MAENLIIVELRAEGQQSVAKELEKVAFQVDELGNEFIDLGKATDIYKQKLSTLKEGSKEFKALEKEIKANEITMKSLNQNTSTLKTQLKNLKAEIASLNGALSNMEKAGLKGTQQYKALEQQMLSLRGQAGDLSDTIGDINEEVSRSGSDTRGLDKTIGSLQAVGGAFQAVTGIQALFGSENEDLQKTLVKLNAIMAITTGAQQFFTEALKKDSLLYPIITTAQRLWAVAIGESTGAIRVLRVAMASLGIGLLIAGIVLLVQNFDKIVDAIGGVNGSLREMKKLNKEVSDEAISQSTNEIATLNELISTAKNENLSRKERQKAINDINKSYPELLSNITLENIGSKETNGLILKQIDLIVAKEKLKILYSRLAVEELEKEKKSTEDGLSTLQKFRKQTITLFGVLKSQDPTKQFIEENQENSKKNIENIKNLILKTQDELGKFGNTTETEKIGSNIVKSISKGIEKEKIGAFDALQKKISEAEKLLNDLKAEQVQGFKDNTTQINKLTAELENYKKILKEIEDFGKQPIKLPIELVLPKEIKVLEGSVEVVVEPRISQDSIEKAVDAFGKTGEKAGQELSRAISPYISKLFNFEDGDDKKTKASKSLEFISGLEQGVTSIINQARAIRTQNDINELENKKKRGLISEEKYQQELTKIKIKEAKRQKRQAIFEATLGVPLAILSGFKSGGFIGAALAGALAVAQLAIVSSTPLPKFKKGGLIGGRLHEQGGTHIEAEKGEFIMKREAVKRYGVNFMESLNGLSIPKPQFNNVLNMEISELKKDMSKLVVLFSFFEQNAKEGKNISRQSNDYLKQIAQIKKGYA